MKKIFFIALLTAFIGTTGFTAPVKTVSHFVQHEFVKKFNDAKNVTWKVTRKFDEAIFTVNGQKIQAFYSHNGKFLGTTKTFAFDKLPAKAVTTVVTKYPYPVYNLQECIEYKNANGNVNYYISFEKKNKKSIVEISPSGSVSRYNNNFFA